MKTVRGYCIKWDEDIVPELRDCEVKVLTDVHFLDEERNTLVLGKSFFYHRYPALNEQMKLLNYTAEHVGKLSKKVSRRMEEVIRQVELERHA